MKDDFKHHLKNYIAECAKDFFYKTSNAYNSDKFKIMLTQENESSAICQKLENKSGDLKGKRVLDIGCGAGGRSVAIALKGAAVIGVEPLIDGVRASRARALKYTDIKADFLIGEGEKIPFKDCLFDLVTSFCVLEHAKRIDEVIFEAYRTLKKGGFFYCELPNHLFPIEGHYETFWFPMMPKIFAQTYFRLRGRNPRGINNLIYITQKGVIKKIKQCGFKNIEDLNINYIKERINNPELMQNINQRRIMGFIKKAGLGKIFTFLIIKFSIYPAIHLCAKKED